MHRVGDLSLGYTINVVVSRTRERLLISFSFEILRLLHSFLIHLINSSSMNLLMLNQVDHFDHCLFMLINQYFMFLSSKLIFKLSEKLIM